MVIWNFLIIAKGENYYVKSNNARLLTMRILYSDCL